MQPALSRVVSLQACASSSAHCSRLRLANKVGPREWRLDLPRLTAAMQLKTSYSLLLIVLCPTVSRPTSAAYIYPVRAPEALARCALFLGAGSHRSSYVALQDCRSSRMKAKSSRSNLCRRSESTQAGATRRGRCLATAARCQSVRSPLCAARTTRQVLHSCKRSKRVPCWWPRLPVPGCCCSSV